MCVNIAAGTGELTFWFFTLLALALPAVAAVNGMIGIPAYEGGSVVSATLLTFPGSIVAIIATVPLTDAFFEDATWAAVGYFVVMPLYLVGAVLWQLIVIVGIRRLAQLSRRADIRDTGVVADAAVAATPVHR